MDRKRKVPASVVRDMFGGISHMCLWRWVNKGVLPQPEKINGRNFWWEDDVIAVQNGRAHKPADSATAKTEGLPA